MKKYSSRSSKWLGLITLICAVIVILGILFSIFDFSSSFWPVGLILFGGILGFLFLVFFLADMLYFLKIDSDQIDFNRGIRKNGTFTYKRVKIKPSEISSVERYLSKGDGIFVLDTFFYTLKLKDGTKLEFTLFNYGKKAEEEIFETLESFT